MTQSSSPSSVCWVASLPLNFPTATSQLSPLSPAPRPFISAFTPRQSRVSPRHHPSPPPASAPSSRPATATAVPSPTPSTTPSVVWFRLGDLRARDHGGLSAALSAPSRTLPVFITTPSTPAGVFPLLSALRTALGGRLYLRHAATERDGLRAFLVEAGATPTVHVHRDLDARALADVDALAADATFVYWREASRRVAPDQFGLVPAEYPQFLKMPVRKVGRQGDLKGGPASGVAVGGVDVEGDGMEMEMGDIDKLRKKVGEQKAASSIDVVEAAYVADSLRVGVENVAGFSEEPVDAFEAVKSLLSRLESDDSIDIARTLQPLFWFGMISAADIRRAVVEYERERGRLWEFVYRLGAKTILRYLDARDFAWCCAERDIASPDALMGRFRTKFYNWRGYLTRYVEAGPTAKEDAVLLVHGFGASAQHWERNIELLSEDNHCFAFCNLGFGRSEKPPAVYTQHLWEMFQASFAKEVVGKPSFIAGNSIGGYLSAAFSHDLSPELCKGVALINSAGSLYSPEEYAVLDQAVEKPKGFLAATLQGNRVLRVAACNLLLNYLQRGIKSTLTRVYPTSPPGWTDDLAFEIKRNSLDWGAVDVIASGFILPKQRCLNDLLSDEVGVPVLVFQGTLDPLGSGGRAEKFRKVVPSSRVEIFEIEAGHCPMDEKPDEFCEVFQNWMSQVSDTQDEVLAGSDASMRSASAL